MEKQFFLLHERKIVLFHITRDNTIKKDEGRENEKKNKNYCNNYLIDDYSVFYFRMFCRKEG